MSAPSLSQIATASDPAVDNLRGSWSQVFDLPNVGIHAHVLPNGKVLLWGRRLNPDNPDDDMDAHVCLPFVWDPVSGRTTSTPQPALADGTKINLFCSGHTFLAPLEGTDKIQWDRATASPRPAEDDEKLAYRRLTQNLQAPAAANQTVTVTGPLKETEGQFTLYVRTFRQ